MSCDGQLGTLLFKGRGPGHWPEWGALQSLHPHLGARRSVSGGAGVGMWAVPWARPLPPHASGAPTRRGRPGAAAGRAWHASLTQCSTSEVRSCVPSALVRPRAESCDRWREGVQAFASSNRHWLQRRRVPDSGGGWRPFSYVIPHFYWSEGSCARRGRGLPPEREQDMSQARLREALTAGGPTAKDRGPPIADGILTVTPDTPEAVEWRSRRSIIDSFASCSAYLDEDDDGEDSGG